MRPSPDDAVSRSTAPDPVHQAVKRAATAVALATLLALTAHAQTPATMGRWSGSSPTRISSDPAIALQTPIHMAWMRGHDDWSPTNGRYHSFLFWWESRADVCGSPRKFHGALYGWNPGYNDDCTGDMMSSGFTLLPLGDEQLDPPTLTGPNGDKTGHNIFCSGHTMLHDGRLFVGGGSGAPENNGTTLAAIFDPLVTGTGSRWTALAPFALPRWYPTIIQTAASKAVYTYAGTQYASMNLIGGSPGAGIPTGLVARHRLNDAAGWDASVTPALDTGTGFDPDEQSPRPRDFAAGGGYKLEDDPVLRTVLFGGKDATVGSNSVRSDVWWMKRNTSPDITPNAATGDLEWFKFTTYTGAGPGLGLWKHSAIIDERNGDLWVWGGLNKNYAVSDVLYKGSAHPTIARQWIWETKPPSGTPPSPRYHASTAYDEQNQRMIVFGGYDQNGVVVADNNLHALDLDTATWSTLTVVNTTDNPAADAPAALAEAAMVAGPSDGEHQHDAAAANLYMYGGKDATGALNADVRLMYFPSETQVGWKKLNIVVDATHPGPGDRRGAVAVRDVDSWNLRVYGGLGAGNAATDGAVWLMDIYRTRNNVTCDTGARYWKPATDGALAGAGRVGAMGVFEPFEKPANTMERFADPSVAPGAWTTNSTVDRYQFFYPLLFPLPDGRILDATARIWGRATDVYNPVTGTWAQYTPAFGSGHPLLSLLNGSAVMRRLVDGTFDILKCGAKDTEGSNAPASGLAARLRINSSGAPMGTWVQTGVTGTMLPRVYHNLVILPDGKVVVTGGAKLSDQNRDNGVAGTDTSQAVSTPQIWDPAGEAGAGSWSAPLADEQVFRGYHAAALGMPDGRVITGAGNDPEENGFDKHRFKVYCPPSRFDANGNLAAGPTLLWVPTQVGYGNNLRIDVGAAGPVEKVVLIRPGAVTHGFNSSQVYVELGVSPCPEGGYGAVDIMTPMPGAVPQGDYLLFAVVGGRWSTGKWLRLGAGLTPTFAGGPAPGPCSGGEGGEGGGEGEVLPDPHSARRDPGALAAHSTATLAPAWVTNTLFAGVADGSLADDRLLLTHGPVQAGIHSRVRLNHRGRGSDAYSSVRLVAVDHAATDEALATPQGIVVGTRDAATSVHDASGAEVSAAMAQSDGLLLAEGDVLAVTLPTGSASLWLSTSGHPVGEGGIRIEESTPQGWREVALHTPRARRDVQVVDGLTSGTLRLVALGQHRLYGVGGFVAGGTAATTTLQPAAMRHSASGEGIAGAAFTLAGGDTAWVDFVTPAEPTEGVREWFLEVTGMPQGYQPSAAALHARHAPTLEPGTTHITAFRLAGGIPNPFTASTRVLFELPRAASVRLEVFDMQGRLVRMVEERFEPGVHTLVWDRRTTEGALVPRGVYPIRVTAGSEQANGRLTVR